MKTTSGKTTDPFVHSQNIQDELTELIDHMRKDVNRVEEPKYQALLETSAEVLCGLRTAFSHYDQNVERAWKR